MLFALSAAITEIEAYQALGKQFNGAMNFVAGMDTVVRVFLDAAVTVDRAQTRLAVLRTGSEKFELQPRAYDSTVKIVEFLCPTREDCRSWAEGSYTFIATINGLTKSTSCTTFDLKTRARLRILVRPVKSNYEDLQSVYPVAAEAILWDVKEEADASDPIFDLETPLGRARLWEALTNLIPKKCAANPKADGCYELVVGFIPERPNGNLQGYIRTFLQLLYERLGRANGMPAEHQSGNRLDRPRPCRPSRSKVRFGAVRALNPSTGAKVWEYKMTDVSEGGIVTTASNLLFTGNREGHFFALDATNGKLLWNIYLGGQTAASPITYLVNGKQRVTIAIGHTLYTLGLRE